MPKKNLKLSSEFFNRCASIGAHTVYKTFIFQEESVVKSLFKAQKVVNFIALIEEIALYSRLARHNFFSSMENVNAAFLKQQNEGVFFNKFF